MSIVPAANTNPSTTDWRLRFVEDMGRQVLVHGAPRAVVRVLSWLIV